MTDYFFISSPLHFCIAANIAIKNPTHTNVAVIISKNSAAGHTYATVARLSPDIFNEVISLASSAEDGRPMSRKAKFKILKRLFLEQSRTRIFTGNDRRSEFQYAMHVATRTKGNVEGIYMDDGAVTYVGHKSMNRFQHRYVDPLFKKMFYGFWWKNAMTTGASAWIESACVAFPDVVCPLLRGKRLEAIDADVFKSDQFISLTENLLAGDSDYRELLAGIKVVVTLPHEAVYLNMPEIYTSMSRYLRTCYDESEIAVKAHPRSSSIEVVREMFPGAVLLDRSIGMEFMLPLLSDECLVIGDVSSTLLTTRWLRPDLAVVALRTMDEIPNSLIDLYRKLQIEIIAAHQLADRFDKVVETRQG